MRAKGRFTFRRLCVEQLEPRQLLAITTLSVQNELPLDRMAEPVTSGVPIPESRGLLDTSRLQILDAGGAVVPAQFNVLGRWGGGPSDVARPIRWLEVHFPATVTASATATYTLDDQGSGNAAAGVQVVQSAGSIEITTGPARFQIDRSRFDLFHAVWLDLNNDGAFVSGEQIVAPNTANGAFVQQGATEFQSGREAPIGVVVEEAGPLRVIVRAEGFHSAAGGADLLRYVARLTFYAGQSYVHVDHTIVEGRVIQNGQGYGIENQVRTDIDRAGLRVRLQLQGDPLAQLRAAQDTLRTGTLTGAQTAEVVQHRQSDWQQPMSYTARLGGSVVESGQQATRAWLDLADARWGLAVGTQHFVQKNPQRLSAAADGTVRVEFPAEPYTVYQAMGLSEQTVFYFHRAGTTPAELARVLEGFGKDPLLAVAPPQWLIASGAFEEIPPATLPPELANFDQFMQDSYTASMEFIGAGKSSGLLNYGDMPIDGFGAASNPDQTAWGNSYYDPPSAQIRQFARTGETRWLEDLAFPHVEHVFTTDMYDTDSPNSWQKGIGGARGAYHREAFISDYHYIESLWSYYYLTGNRRALERGMEAARTYAFNGTWAVDSDFGYGPGLGTRINSQKFHTMLQGYLATGDAALKAALDAQVQDYLTHMATPEGFVVARYSHGNPYLVDQGWMVSLLIHDTVYKYYLATGNQQARDFVALVPQRIAQHHRVSSNPSSPDYLDFYTNIEVTVGGPAGFTTRPVFLNGNSDDYFYLAGKIGLATALARAYKVSGNLALRDQAREIFDYAVPQLSGFVWDKPTAQTSLRLAAGLGILQEPSDTEDASGGLLVAPGPGSIGPLIKVLDPQTLELQMSFYAYNPAFTGGVRVAKGDINGDGTPDIITAPGPGGGPHVRVFDGVSGAPLPGAVGSFFAYHPAFSGGVFVASGDVNGDGRDDIITAAGAGGGPHVRVFSGINGAELFGFFAYHPNFGGGVSVAAGDVNGDGRDDIVTGAGAGGGPHVRVFNGVNAVELFGFFAYHPNFGGGVFVAAGDVNGDGRADIYTGPGAGGGPHVRVISGSDRTELHSFFAYSAAFGGGVRVAAADLDGDGRDDIITAAGPGGGPHVRGLSGVSRADLTGFFAYDAAFAGGVFVAGTASGATPGALLREGQTGVAMSAAAPLSRERLALAEQGPSAAPVPMGRVDLLSVVLPELGHSLGLEHDPASETADELLWHELEVGVRRLPTQALVDAALAGW